MVTAPSLTIGYNGYTVTADGSGVADLYNGDVDSGDLGVSGSLGGISFAATTGVSKGDDNQSFSVGYTLGDLSLSYVSTNNSDGKGESGSNLNDDYDVSVSYTAGALTASVATDEDSVSKLSASYDLGGGVNAFLVNRSGTDGAGKNKDFQAVGINFKF